MSLRIWLPLKTKLSPQYGISDYRTNWVADDTAIDGKIGRCAIITNHTNTNITIDDWNYPSNSVSYGAWFKFNKTDIQNKITSYTWDSNNRTAKSGLIGNINYGGFSLRLETNDIYADGSFLSVMVYSYLRSSASYANISYVSTKTTVPFDTWVHVFTVLDREEGRMKNYVNGVLTSSIVVDMTKITAETMQDKIGNFIIDQSSMDGGVARVTSLPFKINDLRIYDEALSPKQIKEIAKGLVAHFKLDNLSIYNENLFSVFQAGGRTTLSNGIITTTGENGDTYFYINTKKALESGKQYILELCCDGLNPGVTWSFCLGSQSTSSTSYAGEMFIHQGITKFNFTCPEGLNGATRFIMDDLSRPAGTPVIKISNCRLMEYSSAYFLDTSGYGYALTAVDFNLKYILNTPRYSSAISRDTATKPVGRISSGLFLINQTINELTLCGWWKTTVADTNTKNLISLNGNSFIRFGPSSATTLWIYCYFADNNTRYLEATIPYSITDNNWHFYATTFRDGIIKAYVDGNLIGTKDCSADSTQLLCKGTTNYLGGYNASQELVPGGFSDYRIYVTALSADDIKQLYTTCTFIDNKNNMLAYEFVEE